MISGLPDETIEQLRALYPRTSVAELVSRIAAFPSECFASAAYLAAQIGKSSRTVFRYFRKLKDDGGVVRVPGRRDELPRSASKPAPLRAHGYSLTGFVGWLGPLVAQGRALLRDRQGRKQRSRERKEAARREMRAQQAQAHAAFAAEQFPDLAERARKNSAAQRVRHWTSSATAPRRNVPDDAAPEASTGPPKPDR